MTTAPLAELARRAGSAEPFSPVPPGSLRELQSLGQALYELDHKVREREEQLVRAHADAVDLGAFADVVQQVADEPELHRTLARTLESCARPERLQILVHNASRSRLARAWPESEPADELLHPQQREPLRCRAIRTMRMVANNADAAIACDCKLGVPTAGSYLCQPMFAAGEVIGLVNLQTSVPNQFDDGKRVVASVAQYVSSASTALGAIRMLASERERALRDGLTGAYNRSFLDEFLPRALAQGSRRGTPVSLLMIDLDHFKRLNDSYGHAAGDAALVALVACLQEGVRGGDVVVRYGGEEFAVVLQDTDAPTAHALAERIRARVASLSISVGSEVLGPIVRTSIGVACAPVRSGDPAQLLSAADRALYRAKHEGRNRVVVAAGEGPESMDSKPSQ